MEEQILKILRQGRSIEPSGDFKERSRRLIFLAPQRKPSIFEMARASLLENFSLSLSLTLAAFMIFAIIGGFGYWNSGEDATALNGQDIKAEAEKLDFQIQLKEAQYFTQSADEIAALLNEIKRPESKPSGNDLIN